MKNILIAICMLFSFSFLKAQTKGNFYVSTNLTSGKYEIVQSPITDVLTFKVDKQMGIISQRVIDDTGVVNWKNIEVEKTVDDYVQGGYG